VAHTKGPKLNIMLYKNKSGYKRRMGHRQSLTQIRVTGIDTAKKPAAASAATEAAATESKGDE
jgi:hypothetical protein